VATQIDAINLGSPAPAILAAVGALLALATAEVVVAMGTEVEASVRGTSMIARKATNARSHTMPAAVAGLHANPRRLATLVAVAAVVGNQSMLALPTEKAALIANPRSPVMPVALVSLTLRRPVTTPALAEATAVANLGTGKLTTILSALVALGWSCCPCVQTLEPLAKTSPSLMGNEARSSTPRRKDKRFVIRISCVWYQSL
jgi:hypothetical protein